jgi:hypothetical protein
MLYFAYQMQSDVMVPVRVWAGMAASSGGSPLLADHPAMRNLTGRAKPYSAALWHYIHYGRQS